jgi:hypothetical protein
MLAVQRLIIRIRGRVVPGILWGTAAASLLCQEQAVLVPTLHELVQP